MTDDRYDDRYDEYDDGYDDEYEPIVSASRRGPRMAVVVVAAFAVLGIVVAGVLVYASRQIDPPGDPGDKVASIVVPSGASLDDVAELLEKDGVITSASVMGWYAKFNDPGSIEAGRYVDFRKNSSMSEAIEVLQAGPVPAEDVVVTIIPGMWLSDALARINEKFPDISIDALQLTLLSGKVTSKYHADPTASWEGYLLPETYKFEQGATPEQILQTIVDEFDSTLDDLGYGNAQASTGRSAQDLVTIASMIERETGDPDEERPKIARVILNRLERDIPLGIDATLLYGLGRKGDEQPLLKSELETDGPYNTRTRGGLPATAISLPSEKSLQAAISPAEGPWIYYVLESRNPRTHFFTESAREFERAKATCREKGFC